MRGLVGLLRLQEGCDARNPFKLVELQKSFCSFPEDTCGMVWFEGKPEEECASSELKTCSRPSLSPSLFPDQSDKTHTSSLYSAVRWCIARKVLRDSRGVSKLLNLSDWLPGLTPLFLASPFRTSESTLVEAQVPLPCRQMGYLSRGEVRVVGLETGRDERFEKASFCTRPSNTTMNLLVHFESTHFQNLVDLFSRKLL